MRGDSIPLVSEMTKMHPPLLNFHPPSPSASSRENAVNGASLGALPLGHLYAKNLHKFTLP